MLFTMLKTAIPKISLKCSPIVLDLVYCKIFSEKVKTYAFAKYLQTSLLLNHQTSCIYQNHSHTKLEVVYFRKSEYHPLHCQRNIF